MIDEQRARSGTGLQIVDDLAEDRLVEDLFLLGTAGHQGMGADQIDLPGNPLGVVERFGDKAIAEHGGAAIAGDLDLVADVGAGFGEIQGAQVVANGTTINIQRG